MSSLVYLLVCSPQPHIPYISSPNQCLLFATHAHTIATCFAVVSILYPLFLVFLSTPYLGLTIFYLNITHPSDHSHLCSLNYLLHHNTSVQTWGTNLSFAHSFCLTGVILFSFCTACINQINTDRVMQKCKILSYCINAQCFQLRNIIKVLRRKLKESAYLYSALS